MNHSLNWLKEQIKDGKKLTFIGFFGNHSDTERERSFSNFYKTSFTEKMPLGNIETFNCTEQYFMYQKAMLFDDHSTAQEILKPNLHPADYKRLGRQVRNYDDKIWASGRQSVMEHALWLKFSQNPKLKDYLLSTDDAVLVETSPFDRIWGCGIGKKPRPGHKYVDWKNINNWTGQNLLGFVLMDVREQLK